MPQRYVATVSCASYPTGHAQYPSSCEMALEVNVNTFLAAVEQAGAGAAGVGITPVPLRTYDAQAGHRPARMLVSYEAAAPVPVAP